MTLHITKPASPSDADREAVLAPLRAYNVSQAGDPYSRSLALILTDEDGEQVGGLWGRYTYDWLFIEYLAVPEPHRRGNYGTALMNQAEDAARGAGCIGIWLDTFQFQARGFYEKLGYEVFGTLDDQPIGQQQFFMRKRL